MKSDDEQKLMYGEDYVSEYEKVQTSKRIKRIIKYMTLGRDDSVIDFACGNAWLMDYVAPKARKYTGVDFSEPFIEVANTRKQQLKIYNAFFYCSSINEYCEKNKGVFDTAFAMDYSEHVYDEEWLKILKGIRTSLKHKGKLYIHTPNAEFILEIMKRKNFILEQFPHHIAIRSAEHNISLLDMAGFTITRLKLISHYNPVLTWLHSFSYLPLIGKYLKARIFIEATAGIEECESAVK